MVLDKYCVDCGKKLRKGSNFCEFCGAKIKLVDEEDVDEDINDFRDKINAELHDELEERVKKREERIYRWKRRRELEKEYGIWQFGLYAIKRICVSLLISFILILITIPSVYLWGTFLEWKYIAHDSYMISGGVPFDWFAVDFNRITGNYSPFVHNWLHLFIDFIIISLLAYVVIEVVLYAYKEYVLGVR